MLHVLYCYKCNESWCDVDLFLLHFWNSLVLPGFRRRNWKSSSSTIGARAVGALGRHVENTTVAPSELFGSLSDLGASHDRSKTLQFPKPFSFPNSWRSMFQSCSGGIKNRCLGTTEIYNSRCRAKSTSGFFVLSSVRACSTCQTMSNAHCFGPKKHPILINSPFTLKILKLS